MKINLKSLSDQVIVITDASSGIGLAVRLGSALMAIPDPDSGCRRRALIRDKGVHFKRPQHGFSTKGPATCATEPTGSSIVWERWPKE